jgi:hypothetical protein
MSMRAVIALQDNPAPHVAPSVHNTQRSVHWKVLDRPAQRPDLSPCDFHVSGPHRKMLDALRYGGKETLAGVTVGCLPQCH